jgi:cysteine-S-conjugate beta-lyase
VYGPSSDMAASVLSGWGITHQFYNPMDPADLARKITERTRLVWLEAAGSVTLEFPDLPALVRLCRGRGVVCALDNTWGAGLAFNPFDLLPGSGEALGVDVSAHALTKYPSGGGDVLMGSVTTRDLALHRKIQRTHMHLGLGVAANDAELVLRSLPSMAVRYHAHDAATRTLAQWATQRPEFVQVLHPALADSPGHAHWQALCGAAAGLFSVVVDARYSQAQVDAFCDALRLFKLGYSWGGPMSLVVPYNLAEMRTHGLGDLARGTLVRFSIGLEAVADLQADLAQALQQLAG